MLRLLPHVLALALAHGADLGQNPAALLPDISPESDDCWASPLRLKLVDLVQTGRIAHAIAARGCDQRVRFDPLRDLRRSTTFGRTHLADLHLLGEKFELRLDVIVRPGSSLTGDRDELFVVPVLDLPEKWDWFIDDATHVALAVGTAAVITSILIQLLK